MEEEKIVELYRSGKSIRQVSMETGVSYSKIRRLLERRKVSARSVRTDNKTEEQVLRMYNSGESSEKIAEKFGLNGSTICRIIKRNGGKIRPSTENKRKYQIRKDFFKEIDSEEKAWALGFLYADGGVHKNLSSFAMTLHKQDRDVLEKFSSLIYIDHKEIEQHRERYVHFRVSSVEMVSDLIKLGCMPAKTFKLKVPGPNIVPNSLFRHFVRGFIDGDGCIRISNSGRITVIITGYDDFISNLSDKIEKSCDIKLNARQVKNRILEVRAHRQEYTRRLLHWLYDDAKIFMDRKKAKAEAALLSLEDKATKSLNSSTLLTFNGKKLSAKNILTMSTEERDLAAKYVFQHFRERGFPYDRFEKSELMKDFNNLIKKNCELCDGNRLYNNPEAGLKIFRHYCDHYYNVSDGRLPSIHEAFFDDEKLMKAIKNRMGYFFEDEAFNITGRMIRQGLRNGRIAFAASVFKPSVAKFFYDKFEAKNVLDISAGFGQRMIGACASQSVQKYVATDPWVDTITALNKIKEFLSFTNKDIKLYEQGSENFLVNERFDFCFSSPPFFDKEKYSNDNSQAYSGGKDSFMHWWRKTASNIYQMLDGKFVLNMDAKLASEMISDVSDLFDLEEFYYINFKRAHMPKDSSDMYYVLVKK